jgi:hypothetical protein
MFLFSIIITMNKIKVVRIPSVYEPCPKYCQFGCTKNFSKEDIVIINCQFWDKNLNERKDFVLNNIEMSKNSEINKHNEYEYHFKKIRVCRNFFLNSLGLKYHFIYNLLRNIKKFENDWNTLITAPKDKRKYNKFLKNNPIRKLIDKFILSYNPRKSHFRRENCPNKLYIENTNCVEMYTNFAKFHNFTPIFDYKNMKSEEFSNSDIKCTYSYFFKVIKIWNISFIKHCHDKCKICFNYRNHNEIQKFVKICQICITFENHIKEVKEVRNKIRLHSEMQEKSFDNEKKFTKYLVVSLDTQKVLQIPKLPIKDNHFSDKVNCTNFTISQEGKNGTAICLTSNDTEMNKNASDFCNFYFQFCKSSLCNFAEKVIVICDNCWAQNKNWLLLSNLIVFVNEPNFKPQSLIIDYLISGHSYQSADTVHATIELNLRKHQCIYNFKHLNDIISSSRQNLIVQTIKFNEIINFIDYSKCRKEFNLCTVRSLMFKKGSTDIFVKLNDDLNFKRFDILKSNIKLKLQNFINNNTSMIGDLTKKTSPVGISQEKFNSITKDIDSIPENFRSFYNNILINDKRKSTDIKCKNKKHKS